MPKNKKNFDNIPPSKKAKTKAVVRGVTEEQSAGALGIFPLPVIANIASSLGASAIKNWAQSSKYWNNILKTTDAHGVELNEPGPTSIYSEQKKIGKATAKILAMGFEENLMDEWTKGFTNSPEEWQRLETLVDYAQKGLALLNSVGRFKSSLKEDQKAQLEKYTKEIMAHLDVDLTIDSIVALEYDLLNDESSPTHPLVYLNDYKKKFSPAIFAKCNPFLLCMAVLFLPIFNLYIKESLLKLAGKSLKVLVLIDEAFGETATGEKPNHYWDSWLEINLPNHKFDTDYFKNYIGFVLRKDRYFSTVEVVNSLKDFTQDELGSLINAEVVLSKDKNRYFQELLKKYKVTNKALSNYRSIPVPCYTARRDGFLELTLKSQPLACYLLEQARLAKQEIHVFGKNNVDAIGLLSYLNTQQLKNFTEETTIAELSYACRKYSPAIIIQNVFDEVFASKTIGVSVPKLEKNKSYRAKMLKYLEGFQEQNNQIQNDSMENFHAPDFPPQPPETYIKALVK